MGSVLMLTTYIRRNCCPNFVPVHTLNVIFISIFEELAQRNELLTCTQFTSFWQNCGKSVKIWLNTIGQWQSLVEYVFIGIIVELPQIFYIHIYIYVCVCVLQFPEIWWRYKCHPPPTPPDPQSIKSLPWGMIQPCEVILNQSNYCREVWYNRVR